MNNNNRATEQSTSQQSSCNNIVQENQNFPQNGIEASSIYSDLFQYESGQNNQRFPGLKFPSHSGFLGSDNVANGSPHNIAAITAERSEYSNLAIDKNVRRNPSFYVPHIMENFSMKMDATFNVSAATAGNLSGQWNDSAYNVQRPNVQNNNSNVNKNNNMNANRGRTTYTEQQVIELEEAFKCNPYPTAQNRLVLAQKVGVPEGKVKIWFQNRRARAKKIKSAMIMPWKQSLLQQCTKLPEDVNQNNNNLSPLHQIPPPRTSVSLGSLLPLPTTSGTVPPKRLPLNLPSVHLHHQPYHENPMFSHCFRQTKDQTATNDWYRANYNVTKRQICSNGANADNKQTSCSFRLPTVWAMTDASCDKQFPGPQQRLPPVTESDESAQYCHQQPHGGRQNGNFQQDSGRRTSKEENPSATSSGNSICNTVATLDINCKNNDSINESPSFRKNSDNSANQNSVKEESVDYELKSNIHEAYRHPNLMLSPPPIRRFVFPFNTMVNDSSPGPSLMQTANYAPNQFNHNTMHPTTSQYGKTDYEPTTQFWKPKNDNNFQPSYAYQHGYNVNLGMPQQGNNVGSYFGLPSISFPSQGINPSYFPPPRSSQPHDIGLITNSYFGYPTYSTHCTEYDNSKLPNCDKGFNLPTPGTLFYDSNAASDDVTSDYAERRISEDSTESTSETADVPSLRPQAVWTVNKLLNPCEEQAVTSEWESGKTGYAVPNEFAVRT